MNLRLAPGVTFTPLPHGGGVVVNGTTLAVAECGEREAEFLCLLVAHVPQPEPAQALRPFVEELIENQWLLTSHQSDGGC